MMKETTLSRSLRLMFAGGMAMGLGLLAAPALAQTTDAAPQRVEITGSAIKRIAQEGALPVQILTKETIARTGATTIADLIQKLPAMQGFTIEAIAAGTNSGGRTTASIHDLGSSYTLVLINGRRIAPLEDSGSAANLNAIPMAAVERVEVLTDGASALYGSDAIAGVINFVLKTNQQGGTVEAGFNAPEHSGGGNWNANLSYGFGNLDEHGFNVLFAYRHDEQSRMKATDRNFAKTSYIPFTWDGGNYVYDRTSTSAVPANATVRFTTASGLPSYGFNPYMKQNGRCADLNFPYTNNTNTSTSVTDYCGFDFAATVEIIPESKRDMFFTTGQLKLGQNATLFADAALGRFDLTARIAPNPVNVTIPTTSQYYTDYVRPYLTAAQAAAVRDVTANFRALDWGTRDSNTITDVKHLVTGVKADVAGWDLNSALLWSKYSIDEHYVGGYMKSTEFRDMLNTRAFNPFLPPGQQSDATKQLIANSLFKGSIREASSEMKGVDARASRELFALGGGNAGLAIGAEYRELHQKLAPTTAATNGTIFAFSPSTPYDYKRDSYGAFAEFLAPIMKGLELTASVRYDKYSAIDDSLNNTKRGKSQDQATYKLSARYQPTTALLFRGSYGTGFRVPDMLDIARPVSPGGVTAGSYECPANLRAENADYCRTGRQQYSVLRGGNENLKPEKSEQYTIGFRFEPSANFGFGLDLWDVEMEDQVSNVSERQAFAEPAKFRDLYKTFVEPSTGQTFWAFLLAPVNIGRSHNQGIDWDFTVGEKYSFGKLTLEVKGTHLLKSDYTEPGTDDKWVNSMNKYGINNAVSFSNIFKGTLTLETGALTNSLTMAYRNGYEDARTTFYNVATKNTTESTFRITVPSYTTFDWQGKYAVNKAWEVRAGIKNLFDKEPPLTFRTSSGHQVGYDPRYADTFGRTFYMSSSYKF